MKRYLMFFVLVLTAHCWSEPISEQRLQEVIPEFSAYVEQARQAWSVPSVAVAIVRQDGTVWWKGYGQTPPDEQTIFAVGSTTKAFAAATLALMVDDGAVAWDGRVVEQVPEFQMFDPWVTREVRVEDLLAQHPGIPPQALSGFGAMGYEREQIWKALRWVEPVTSFRSRFAYVNSLHLIAGEMVARWAGADSWEEVLEAKLLGPLGMSSTSGTAAAFEASSNKAVGHATIEGQVRAIPTGPFPYVFGPAGGLNSNLHDMARWVRFQLGAGELEGRRLTSEENLLYTRSPRTIISDRVSYAQGWVLQSQPKFRYTWHNGGTAGHSTFVGFQPEQNIGLIVLTNLGAMQMADAVGYRFFDMVNGAPEIDYSAELLKKRAENPTPPPPPEVRVAVAEELYGEYSHPSLGPITITAGPRIAFHEPGVQARLIPIGLDRFRVRFEGGWLEAAGWAEGGTLRFYRPFSGNSPFCDLMLGDPGEGTTFRLDRVEGE